MPDVFDAIPLDKHTGQGPMTVAALRRKYGPGLTFTADPAKWRIVRGWERSQVQVLTLHFTDKDGRPVSGATGAYFWPDCPQGGVTVVSDANGNIDWAFSSPSFYDADAGEVGPYKFVASSLEIKGLGSPSKNHAYNHDSMSFDIVVNPSAPAPSGPPPVTPPQPSQPTIPPGSAQANFILQRLADARLALDDIEQALR